MPSTKGADASADGAENALDLPLFDEVLFYQSSGYCAQWADCQRAFGRGSNAGPEPKHLSGRKICTYHPWSSSTAALIFYLQKAFRPLAL